MVERVCQYNDQGFKHEMRLHHHQSLMDQVIIQLSATHIELHRARDLIKDAMWEIRCLRMKIVVWGLHDHALGKCPIWLSAETSGTKSNACTPSITKKDLKSDATSPRLENTVSAPIRLERPKARTRENARKRTHLPKKVTFKNIEKGEPSTRAPPIFTPREPTKDYIQLYRYFDWKAEVDQNLGWLTARGTDMKTHLDFHTDLATDMSGQMSEMEQDIIQNHDRSTTSLREVVSFVSLFLQLYR
ncbi:hypothetical protein L1987_06567 [Smallanthus sonchifolius]|uniref:Uncharacterized protein n=1 Tax=Smallanthus sonchifolius TaxID=185202 RepID=A0ACB9JYG0_9ASTR|nr:hypothetical protein L1987_06567 [Smallanthus sonchifolius]